VVRDGERDGLLDVGRGGGGGLNLHFFWKVEVDLISEGFKPGKNRHEPPKY